MNHNTSTPPIIIPDNLRIATLFPDAAIRPRREAEPFKEVDMEENVSDYSTRVLAFVFQRTYAIRVFNSRLAPLPR